jgi:hypothetical protein
MSRDVEEDGAGQDSDRRRERSPNYPSIGFGDALALAKKIFDKDRRHPMSPDTAAKHLGYAGVNGTSKILVSALRKYGLLEPHDGQLRISDDAAGVILLGKDSSERKEKIRRLALRPGLFQELIQEFPDGLPSDENLSATLQYRYKFTGAAATRVIQSLRESLASVEGGGLDASGREVGEPSEPASTEPLASKGESAVGQARPAAGAGAGAHEVWDLGEGVRAELRITGGALGPDQLDVLKQYVEVLAFKVSRSAKKESNVS